MLCVSTALQSAPASAGGSAWFEQAVTSSGFHLGQPAIGRITRRPVVPLSLVVRNDQGKPIALAVVSLDLLRLQALMLEKWTARDGVLALVNSDSRFLVRSPDTLTWIGREASDAVRTLKVAPGGTFLVAKGREGVERVFAVNDLGRYGLRVAASIPSEQVLGLANAQIRTAVLVAGLAAALAAALAVLGARALAGPMRSRGWGSRNLTGDFLDTGCGVAGHEVA